MLTCSDQLDHVANFDLFRRIQHGAIVQFKRIIVVLLTQQDLGHAPQGGEVDFSQFWHLSMDAVNNVPDVFRDASATIAGGG